MTTCLVPLKDLRYAKRRLAPVLGPGERRQICLAMLFDVVAGLKQVPSLGDIRVLTSDTGVEAALRVRHADVAAMRDPAAGTLNGALTHAIGILEREGVSRVLIVPADLPLVEPGDIGEVLATGRGIAMAIAHDKTGEGTNLLLLRPPSVVELRFGPRSFARHVHQARRKGIGYRVFSNPSLLWDLDGPQDVPAFLSRGPQTETGRELLRLGIRERIACRPLR